MAMNLTSSDRPWISSDTDIYYIIILNDTPTFDHNWILSIKKGWGGASHSLEKAVLLPQ